MKQVTIMKCWSTWHKKPIYVQHSNPYQVPTAAGAMMLDKEIRLFNLLQQQQSNNQQVDSNNQQPSSFTSSSTHSTNEEENVRKRKFEELEVNVNNINNKLNQMLMTNFQVPISKFSELFLDRCFQNWMGSSLQRIKFKTLRKMESRRITTIDTCFGSESSLESINR